MLTTNVRKGTIVIFFLSGFNPTWIILSLPLSLSSCCGIQIRFFCIPWLYPPPFEPHRLVCRNKAVYPFLKTAKHDSPVFMDKSRRWERTGAFCISSHQLYMPAEANPTRLCNQKTVIHPKELHLISQPCLSIRKPFALWTLVDGNVSMWNHRAYPATEPKGGSGSDRRHEKKDVQFLLQLIIRFW